LGALFDYRRVTEHKSHGPKKELNFIPGEYEDVVFVTTENRALRVLVWLIAPILRAVLSVRRYVRRRFGSSPQPPNER
jgi:hypothetical protein